MCVFRQLCNLIVSDGFRADSSDIVPVVPTSFEALPSARQDGSLQEWGWPTRQCSEEWSSSIVTSERGTKVTPMAEGICDAGRPNGLILGILGIEDEDGAEADASRHVGRHGFGPLGRADAHV